MPQTSMLNFFSKTPKGSTSTPGKSPLTASNKGDAAAKENNVGKFVAGLWVLYLFRFCKN